MFTGIIEYLGEIKSIRREGSNQLMQIAAPFDTPVKVDQSISHNGACLTLTEVSYTAHSGDWLYTVAVVDETLKKTNLGTLVVGAKVNVERSMKVGDRLDGHFVQGHVDDVGRVESVEEVDGSWIYAFSYNPDFRYLIVPKGSICINGVSLTVIDCTTDRFNVTIIPYTYHHTTFQYLRPGDQVNLEFDILGKYITRMMKV